VARGTRFTAAFSSHRQTLNPISEWGAQPKTGSTTGLRRHLFIANFTASASHRPSLPASRASPTKEMAATTAPTVPTDGLWTLLYLYLLPPPSLCHSSSRSYTRILLIIPKGKKVPRQIYSIWSYSINRSNCHIWYVIYMSNGYGGMHHLVR
jgi:hypothetical protein